MSEQVSQPVSSLSSPLSLASGVAEAAAAPVVVFTNGAFDVPHFGHAQFLRACKRFGTKLIVGLNSDASVRRLKGSSRPICNEVERSGVLEEFRSVDEVILFSEDTPCELIARLKPDIIVKGPGYSEANMPEAAIVNAYGGRVVILDGPPISTTAIIERIRQCPN